MAHDERCDAYLDDVTAGLRDDPELRLDVRAELASHLEERQREAVAAGMRAEDAAARALKEFGAAPELAENLLGANRRRMRRRALLRHAARWLLVPVSVLVAVLSLDLGRALSIQGMIGDFSCGAPRPVRNLFARLPSRSGLPFCGAGRRRLTPDQQLILHGDSAEADPVARQRAIWERWPEDKVCLHNYLTHLLANRSSLHDAPEAEFAEFAEELKAAQAHDPDNARFDYLLAGQLLRRAVIDTRSEQRQPDGTTKSTGERVVRDPAALAEALALVRAGAAKPEYRRYAREMLVRRLEILGAPETLLDQVAEISLAAGQLLPDLGVLRNVVRESVAHAEGLIAAGRGAEAEPFLEMPKRLVLQLAPDCFTLIDLLVVAAVAGVGEEKVPPLYEALGQPAKADAYRRDLAALRAPVERWRAHCKAPETKAQLEDSRWHAESSLLVRLLLPVLGELPEPAELRPSRLVEYALADSLLVSALSLCLLGAMLLCALHTFAVRLVAGRGAGSFLLLPDGETTLRIQFVGIVLPLVGFLLFTRLLPVGGRMWNLGANKGVTLLLYLLFVCAGLGLTWRLTARTVRSRCLELGVPVPPRPGRVWDALAVAWVLFVALLLLLAGGWPGPGAGHWFSWRSTGGLLAGGVILLVSLLALLARGVRMALLRFRARGALRGYCATVTRALVPVFALALIVLNLTARPYLAWEERRWVRQDTLLRVDAHSGGFTSLEARLVDRLRAEIAQAAARLAAPAAVPPKAPAPAP